MFNSWKWIWFKSSVNRPHILVHPHFCLLKKIWWQQKHLQLMQNEICWCLQSFLLKTSTLTQNMKRNVVLFTALKSTSDCDLVSIVCLADVCLVPVLTRCHFCCEFISHRRHFNCLLLEFLRSTSLKISYHHHRCDKKCTLNSTWAIFSQPFPNLRIERERL